MSRKSIIYALILLITLTGIAFLPSLHNSLTNWDDHLYITDNKAITSLSPRNIASFFTSFHWGLYHPVLSLVLAVQYHFSGLDPFTYHATNFALHISNSVLVFCLIFMLTRKVWPALFTSLLFGVHPVHVESVAWAAELKDVLYSFFFLGALICYLKSLKTAPKKWYAASILLFLLSLFTKAAAITLPVILLAVDYYLERPLNRKNLFKKIPFFALAFIFGVVTVSAHSAPHETLQLNLIQRIFAASYGIIFYLLKLLVPASLSAVYPYGGPLGNELPVIVYAAPVILALIFYAYFRLFRFNRTASFGVLFFLVTLSPMLHIIPIGQGFHADRFMYMPSIGVFFMAGLALSSAGEKSGQAGRWIVFLCTILALTLSYMTYQRCRVWKDSITLWSDVIAKYPDFAKAYKTRADAYREEQEHEKAKADYNKALELYPGYAEAYNNRGNMYDETGDYDRVIDDFSAAIGLKPWYAGAYYNRGLSYSRKKEFRRALLDYTKAIELSPAFDELYNNRGVAYAHLRDFGNALKDFNKALELNPKSSQAKQNRANILFLTGGKNP